ncbi:hypothetical protein KGF56_000859 [Candida oxycetoniae]|uniref:Dilute domain-containing protein n=1 Tax=Candida oxycetoniae TaxID=497107 RepID=A0AAI9T075_9ASCO|nr:uncharacterized protein KGF56_000859 [Candida oxycetoniae]KAI3406378.2 hypothetical protein KGF56_000859 [Candida oxycetoniae]
MSAWAETRDQASAAISGFENKFSTILNLSDPLLEHIIASKRALKVLESKFGLEKEALEKGLEGKALEEGLEGKVLGGLEDEELGLKGESQKVVQFLVSSCDGDAVTLESILSKNPQLVDILYPSDSAGVTALIYAVCFNNEDTVESLLENHGADPDLFDTIVFFTPLMWAVYLNQLEMIKLLLNNQADPYLSPKDDGKNAISLLNPERQDIIEYFRAHNLLKNPAAHNDVPDIYSTNTFTPQDGYQDDLSTKLKLQTLSGTIEDESGRQQGDTLYDGEKEENNEDDEYILVQDPILSRLPDFEYDKLIAEQYIKFADSDIPSLINYLFDLRNKTTYQHDTKLPSAILFQLIRYAHLRVDSNELTDFLFDCFTARLRTITSTKSGAFNMALQETGSAQGAGDIVLLSYWLSALQFLHFYFCKSKIYIKFPRFLQEIINLVHSLIATLSFSINSRLNLLVEDCMLNFTSLIDVSNTLYAKDWNLFKWNKKHPNNYDAIMNSLYPPSHADLMKPSPLRYIQVLGALDYVLKIHKVDNLFRMQTFSQVFYYMNCIIFNNIIGSSKFCTRSKAVQIRLNISAIEDWMRSHNLKFSRPETLGGLNSLIGDTKVHLHNLLSDNNTLSRKNPQNLEFYYDSLYHVCKNQLMPTIELLQWLQCMSSLTNQESLINTINQFDYLNYYQLFKVANKLYKYEVGEPRLSKALVSFMKSLMIERGEEQIAKSFQHYMTQSTFLSKEIYIYLNPNYVFNVTLPNLAELLNNYGSGIGGVHVLRSKKYQPSLPISIVDDIDEIITENRNMEFNESVDYEKESENKEGSDDNQYCNNDNDKDSGNGNDNDNVNVNGDTSEIGKVEGIKGDELFKQVQMPNTLIHKHWGETNKEEFEQNPW